MSKHSNREKEVMLHLQKHYQGIRVWRFDVGQAYARHTVKFALEEYKRTGSITQAMKKLQVISYGTKGFPDLAGIYFGIFIGIEIKVGKDRQRKEQSVMEKVIKKAGGIYILLDDKSSIERQLQPLEKVKQWASTQK
jgi:hypothetical protein